MQIYFTPADLGRVRLALQTDLALESILSAQLLRSSRGTEASTTQQERSDFQPSRRAMFSEWCCFAHDQLQSPEIQAAARCVATLSPADLWTAPSEEVENALRVYRRGLIDPYRLGMDKALAEERTRRARVLCEGGCQALLESYAPDFGWTFPVLELPGSAEPNLPLDGRGLILVPTFFCSSVSLFVDSFAESPLLIHPVGKGVPQTARCGIDSLVGVTRAAVLEVAGTGTTTTELAQLVGISAATASHHATVLRAAGLLVTQREANRMVHVVTSLGRALLRQGC